MSQVVPAADYPSPVGISARLATRLLTIAVLLFGVVAMHHLAGPHHARGADQSAPVVAEAEPGGHESGIHGAVADGVGSSDASEDAHGLLHLCLAVLTAAVSLLAAWMLLARDGALVAPPRAPVLLSRLPARSPPRLYGSSLLLFLCVMRT